MKKLLFISVFTWYVFTNASEPCKEPVWYEMDFGDDVTHYWSRSLYWDMYGDVDKTNDIINKKWEGKTIQEINYFNVLKSRSESSDSIKSVMDSLILAISN